MSDFSGSPSVNDPSIPAWWEEHPLHVGALVVAIVAIAASFTGLWNGFAYDDMILIPENPVVTTLRAPLAYFKESYWGPVGDFVALYRPVIVLSWAWEWALGGGAPWLFHAVNIVLYAATCVMLLVFLRQLVPHGGALLGALLFAAHPVHVEAVANVVGQSELLVAVMLLGSLALYARDRRVGRLRRSTAVVIVCGFIFGLFTKEHAIVLPALLLGVEWTGRRLRFAAHSEDWRDARLLILSLGLIAALYLMWRAHLLGEVTGDLPHWAMYRRTVWERIAIMTALVPEFVRLLLYPARLYADYAPGLIPVLPHFGLRHIPGILILFAIAAGVILAWRRGAPLPVFALLWFAVTFAPTSNIFFPIGVIMAERTLFLPSVALVILFAWVTSEAARWPMWRRSLVASAVIAAVAFGTLHSAIRTRVWTDNPTLFSTLLVEAPTNFRGLMMVGGLKAIVGQWDTADSMFQAAMEHYPDHVPARLAYVNELQVNGHFDRALEQVRIARKYDPEASQVMMSETLSLLYFQRFTEARRLMLDGAAAGWATPLLQQLRSVTDSMLAVTDTVDIRNRFVREGRPFARWTQRLEMKVNRELRKRPVTPGAAQSALHSASNGANSPAKVIR